jgi:hypothetical protein
LQVQISKNVSMPLIGFGTAGLGNQTQQAVQIALASGYRLIDSAQVRACCSARGDPDKPCIAKHMCRYETCAAE